MSGPDPRRRIPGVDRLLASEAFAPLLDGHGRERIVRVLRGVVDETRAAVAGGGGGPESIDLADPAAWARRTGERLRGEERPSLRRVINGTGVVLHTNLGRAPLADEALDAAEAATRGYAALQIDLATGERGSRHVHCAGHLRTLTGAEDALVVNNAAAGVLLAAAALARGREVVVSRGELVEIGGGFRIPEILLAAGARIREVGTTNRTRIGDYAVAVQGGEPGLLLKVHRSNFRVTGFTEEASLEELATLAARAGLPLVHDVGSGLLHPPGRLGLPAEPLPGESLERGADLVVFSGDKLLGGPQAGIVAGRRSRVAELRGHPLHRALRIDRGSLAALEATLRLHLDPERALARIPVLRMIAEPASSVRERAEAIRARLQDQGVDAAVREGRSVVGGGTFPGVTIDTALLVVDPAPRGADDAARRLRTGEPPVVPRVEGGRVVLDLRTVLPSEEDVLAERLAAVLRSRSEASEGDSPA